MKNITYVIIALILLFTSCAGNDFSFDEEKQLLQAGSTYFGKIRIEDIDNYDAFYIKRKTGSKKVYSINLNDIPESFYVQTSSYDTIRDFKLKRNCKYEIRNMGVYDATTLKIVIYVDKNGFIKEVNDSTSERQYFCRVLDLELMK